MQYGLKCSQTVQHNLNTHIFAREVHALTKKNNKPTMTTTAAAKQNYVQGDAIIPSGYIVYG